MTVITKKQLLEAGVHFGHNTRRWNPKMKEYIYEERNGIYIIDLTKTEALIEDAYKELYRIAQNGGSTLFVGTRKQTQDVIKEEATRSSQFYVDQRWLGGTLTNFKTIRKSIGRLFRIEEMEQDGTFEVLPKKEVSLLKKEKEKLDKYFSGIRDMKQMPNAMVVVDPKTEHNAVAEARKLGIPIFALVDTNCDPDEVDFVIPGNDDAIRSVKLIVATLANAIVEANGGTPVVIEFTDDNSFEDRQSRYRGKGQPQRGGRSRGGRSYGDREYRGDKKPYEPRTSTQRTDSKPAAPREDGKSAPRVDKPAPKREVKPEVTPKKEVKPEVTPKVEVKPEVAPKKEVKADTVKEEVKASEKE